MRQYTAIMGAYFRSQLQYRTAAWAGIGTQLFFGFIKVMIFSSFFESSTVIQPMNFNQVINYLWLGQTLIMLLPFRVDNELANLIRSGNVAYELTRPVDLYMFWYFRSIAMRVAPVFLRAFPLIIATAFIFPLTGLSKWALLPPESISVFLLFLLSLMVAFLLAASISVLMSIIVLWSISSSGIDLLMPAIIWIFSGIIIPLPFFPDWMQKIFNFLPFRGMIDIPFRIYNGDISGNNILTSIATQIIWIIALTIFGKLLLGRGLKRITVQGG